ncbi:MAG: chloride channel protein, partial [Limosilactobacillus sp.]
MVKITKNLPLAIATVVLGVVVGFSSLLVSVVLDLTEHLFLHFQETNL